MYLTLLMANSSTTPATHKMFTKHFRRKSSKDSQDYKETVYRNSSLNRSSCCNRKSTRFNRNTTIMPCILIFVILSLLVNKVSGKFIKFF